MNRWIEVDLSAIRQNIKTLKSYSPNSELMAVVKADAYGHGLLETAKASREAGATWLGTALFEEAIELRDAGDSGKILAWLGDEENDFQESIARDIHLGVSTFSQLEKITKAATSLNKKAQVHIKVDTGLNRNGISLEGFQDFYQAIKANDALNLVGIMSHFAFPDDPENQVNHEQIARVNSLKAQINESVIFHLANSMATLELPQAHFDLVRPGLAIYGLHPQGKVNRANEFKLKPALSLKAKIVNLKDAKAAEGVSYNHTYRTQSDTKLAVIPLGYSDGIDRRAANSAPIEIEGKTYKISGRVCMDQFVVDVGQEFKNTQATATLFGDSAKGFPSVEDWADAVGTINYEIIARLASRLKRVYLN
ncbi:MAG: alanine racemase [Candidatus Nanopelagicales bacterium]